MLLDDLAARPTSNLQEKYDKKNKYEEEMNAISDAFHSGIFIDQKKGKDLIQKEVDEKFRKWELIE